MLDLVNIFWSSVRKHSLRRVAYRERFRFQPGGCPEIYRLLRDFELYRGKTVRRSANALHRTDEWGEEEFYVFDFHFLKLLPGPKYSRPHWTMQTAFFANSNYLELPEFIIRPRNEDSEWTAFWRDTHPVAFPKHAAFERLYTVRAKDPDFTHAFFSPPLLHFLSYEDGWTIEGLHHLLVIYRLGQLTPPAEMGSFFDTCRELYTRLRVPTV